MFSNVDKELLKSKKYDKMTGKKSFSSKDKIPDTLESTFTVKKSFISQIL
mgnify:CR=1 FL=1